MRLKPSFRKPRSGCPESITAIAAEPAPAVATDSGASRSLSSGRPRRAGPVGSAPERPAEERCMNILMPQLGETVAEGKITKWFKSAGDAVKPGDNLFEIETDKVSMEVPATEAGVLSEIRVQEGETAPVGAIVGVIGGAAAGLRIQMQPARPASEAPRSSPSLPAPAPAAPPERPTRPCRRRTAADQARPLLRGAHAGTQFRPGAALGRRHGDPAGAPACRRGRHRSRSRARLRPARPHCRARRGNRAALPGRGRAGGTGRSECRTGQGALRSRRATRR